MTDAVIRIFENGTEGRARLETAAQRMTEQSGKGYRYYVGETYFDFGQGWMWTTVLCDDGNDWGGFQALCPAEQEEVLFGDVEKAVSHYFSDEHCLDRRKTA